MHRGEIIEPELFYMLLFFHDPGKYTSMLGESWITGRLTDACDPSR